MDNCVNAFKIESEDKNITISKFNSLTALDTNLILEDLMGTSSLNSSTKQDINDMFTAIENDNLDIAESIANRLYVLSNGLNVDVINAKMLIDRRRRLNATNS